MDDFDAVLLLSFGGPEGPEQVRPFLENVTRGRGIPPERLDDVAKHYLHFGGVSPINGINRALIEQLEAELADAGLDLPVYFGNRNWEPYVEDAVAAMRDNGVRRAAVFTTSAWGGYSSCTQYVEDIARGRKAAGDAHPNWSSCASTSTIRCSWRCSPRRSLTRRKACPRSCATTPGWCSPRTRFRSRPAPGAAPTFTPARSRTRRGSSQPRRATTISTRCGSRGPARHRCPGWNPMSADHLSSLADAGTKAVIVCPIGFVADHIEVVWDLDNELRQQADDAGVAFARARTPNADRRFARLAVDLIDELRQGREPAQAGKGRMPLRCMAFRSTGRSARLTASQS